MKRFLCLGLVLSGCLLWSSCGDTFRPIIIPNPPVFPNPQAAHTVVSINNNGTVVAGTSMVVDVSGDTDVSIANVGLVPVHAVQQTAGLILVANQSVPGAQADSVTRLNFSSTTISTTATISLPANSAPNFVATTEQSEAYVLLPNYIDPTTSMLTPSFGVINTVSNFLAYIVPVGNSPVAMTETPDGTKLYVANNADNTIDGFNTSDRSSRTIIGTFTAPLWASARSDSQRVYVLNGTGVISTLDTTSTAGPDNVIDASVSAPGASYMLYDGNLNRLYLPQGAQGQLTILDVAQSVPSVLTGGSITTCQPNQSNCISTVPPSSRSSSDPCSLTTVQPLIVASVASLPDGSRAYVGAYYTDSNDNVCPQVTEINSASNTVVTSIAVPGFPDATNPKTVYYVPACATTRDMIGPSGNGFRFSMAAGGDSSRVYLASCDGGMVNIINTTTESYILNLPEPIGTRPLIPPAVQNPPQNPIFLLAGP
jgi:DNA-binding beta-propeller fold protein YncE